MDVKETTVTTAKTVNQLLSEECGSLKYIGFNTDGDQIIAKAEAPGGDTVNIPLSNTITSASSGTGTIGFDYTGGVIGGYPFLDDVSTTPSIPPWLTRGYTSPIIDSIEPSELHLKDVQDEGLLPHISRAVNEGLRRKIEMDTIILDKGLAVSQGAEHVDMIMGLKVKYAEKDKLPCGSSFVIMKSKEQIEEIDRLHAKIKELEGQIKILKLKKSAAEDEKEHAAADTTDITPEEMSEKTPYKLIKWADPAAVGGISYYMYGKKLDVQIAAECQGRLDNRDVNRRETSFSVSRGSSALKFAGPTRIYPHGTCIIINDPTPPKFVVDFGTMTLIPLTSIIKCESDCDGLYIRLEVRREIDENVVEETFCLRQSEFKKIEDVLGMPL